VSGVRLAATNEVKCPSRSLGVGAQYSGVYTYQYNPGETLDVDVRDLKVSASGSVRLLTEFQTDPLAPAPTKFALQALGGPMSPQESERQLASTCLVDRVPIRCRLWSRRILPQRIRARMVVTRETIV